MRALQRRGGSFERRYNCAMRCGPITRLSFALAFVFAACGGDEQAAKQARDEAAFVAAAAHDRDLADALGQMIVETAQREAAGWVKEGALFRGSLEERGRQDFLVVLKYGHCYRFIGVSGDENSDLDLLLFDGNGVEKQRDVTRGQTATLGSTASICPGDATAVRIEARMRHGHGPFAIALMRNPD
ncbi:MAG TPA: hypothetical protein VHZ95_02160 [Polyangiales bacterium]|nr:hypothetical protein [Polyangiales bacterium]